MGGPNLLKKGTFLILILNLIFRRRQQQQQQNPPAQPNNQNAHGNGAESPDMDFLEMDFDPGEESDTDDAKSNEDTNSTPEVPILRPQELRLDLIEEPATQGILNREIPKVLKLLGML